MRQPKRPDARLNASKARWPCLCFTLLSLALLTLLAGCDNGGQTSGAQQQPPWPEAAIVADLTQPSNAGTVEATLAKLKAAGFDTVLLDARVTSAALLQRWIEAAKRQQLRTVVQIGAPEDALPGKPDAPPDLDDDIAGADGIVLTLRHAGDLNYARTLRSRFTDTDAATALIAHVAPTQDSGRPVSETALPGAVFDAVFSERDDERLLQDKTPPAATATSLQQQSDTAFDAGLPQWQRHLRCQADDHPRCSEDVRLLVMGFMRPPVPVAGFIEGAYWHDVYESLIRLRRENPWIREGELHWYAPDAADGVLAYRIFNDSGQHVIVALNVSDSHHELPLPPGFMAVSKIRIWTAYDPTVRELVTSKPVVLPARSAVVILDK